MKGPETDLIEELGIVGAGEHRLDFHLTLTIAPLMNVADLTEAERKTLARNVEQLIREAVERKAIVQHKGRDTSWSSTNSRRWIGAR